MKSNEVPLTDEGKITPGPAPSKERLEEWLRPDENEEGVLLSDAIATIKRKLVAKGRARKSEAF